MLLSEWLQLECWCSVWYVVIWWIDSAVWFLHAYFAKSSEYSSVVLLYFKILGKFRPFFVHFSFNFRPKIQILFYDFRPRFSEKIRKIRISPISSRTGKNQKTKSEILPWTISNRIKCWYWLLPWSWLSFLLMKNVTIFVLCWYLSSVWFVPFSERRNK